MSLARQITSAFNKKIGCFCKAIFLILSYKQPSLLLNGKVIWQASDSSLTKEFHGLTIRVPCLCTSLNSYTFLSLCSFAPYFCTLPLFLNPSLSNRSSTIATRTIPWLFKMYLLRNKQILAGAVVIMLPLDSEDPSSNPVKLYGSFSVKLFDLERKRSPLVGPN